jgi:hypothetical protein
MIKPANSAPFDLNTLALAKLAVASSHCLLAQESIPTSLDEKMKIDVRAINYHDMIDM